MKMWKWIVENASAVSALATCVGSIVAIALCLVTICNISDTTKIANRVISIWKQSQGPNFCVERRGRLATDGKNFSHEDLFVSNLGHMPKSIKAITVKEYHLLNVTKSGDVFNTKTLVLPIWFYQYGSYTQQLTGRVFSATGDDAREHAFNFDVDLRAFLDAKGYEVNSSTKVVVYVRFVDVFGDIHEECFDADSVGGHDIITKEEFDSYEERAKCLFEMMPQKIQLNKVDFEKLFGLWVLPDEPKKVLSNRSIEK